MVTFLFEFHVWFVCIALYQRPTIILLMVVSIFPVLNAYNIKVMLNKTFFLLNSVVVSRKKNHFTYA